MERGPHVKTEAGPRKARRCLRCDRMFPSAGPHLRICKPCAQRQMAEPSAAEVYSLKLWSRSP
jgi:hypothetical protein